MCRRTDQCSFLVVPLVGHRGLLTKALVTTMLVIPSLNELEDCSACSVNEPAPGLIRGCGRACVRAVRMRESRTSSRPWRCRNNPRPSLSTGPPPSPAALAEGEGGVSAALVAVMDDRVRAALLHGPVQGVEHEFGVQVRGSTSPRFGGWTRRGRWLGARTPPRSARR